MLSIAHLYFVVENHINWQCVPLTLFLILHILLSFTQQRENRAKSRKERQRGKDIIWMLWFIFSRFVADFKQITPCTPQFCTLNNQIHSSGNFLRKYNGTIVSFFSYKIEKILLSEWKIYSWVEKRYENFESSIKKTFGP